MEAKIMDVLRRMQLILDEVQLRELKEVLQMTFTGCRVIQETDLQVVDRSWEVDLEEFLMSKALEGKASKTVKQYRYELVRLLTYINKPVKNIDSGDISGFMRAYKMIRKVANQTLKNVRAVYSSFFVWLRDRDRIRRNPMVLVESIKVEKKIRKPYTDEERDEDTVVYENYTKFDAIVKYTAGILGVLMYREGEDPDSRMAALEARLKEAEEKNTNLQSRVEKAEEKNEMLEGCILEMSETVYQ